MRALLAAPLLWLLSAPLWADARSAVLVDVLGLAEIAQVLQAEGLDYAQTLNDDMMNGQGGPGWQVQVDAIYDPARMVETLRSHLDDALQGEIREEVIAFFAEDPGATIIKLENEARAAIADPEIEETARARYTDLAGTDDPRLARIGKMIDSGDMMQRNIAAAMNSNFQFMRGMADGGLITMSEDDMLAEVSAQYDEIAQDTESWLYGYLLLAYSPLQDETLDGYIAFANTPAGQTLNRALFDGFGAAYAEISYALGRAIALNTAAEDL